MADENVDHPSHYGGGDNPYETIKVLEAWDWLMAYHFCVGNSIKYLSRAGKKDAGKLVEDMKKAAWYSNKAVEIWNRPRSNEEVLPDKPTELLHVEDDNETCGRGCPVWEWKYVNELERRMRKTIAGGDGIHMAGDY